MRFSRHSKNRLRWLARSSPGLSAGAILESLFAGVTVGYDAHGKRRVSIVVGGTELIVVVDDEEKVVITLWEA